MWLHVNKHVMGNVGYIYNTTVGFGSLFGELMAELAKASGLNPCRAKHLRFESWPLVNICYPYWLLCPISVGSLMAHVLVFYIGQ